MATNLHQVKRGYADLKRSGTQMYYERMGHGDPVILIHQCWWNNFEFEGVIPMLAKEYTIYSPDSLGFGFSPAAPQRLDYSCFTVDNLFPECRLPDVRRSDGEHLYG